MAEPANGAGERPIVSGIGGVFILADDPEALAAWYARHLGISLESYDRTSYHTFAWRREDGQRATTTWSIQPADEPLPGRRTAIVNYHVDDLDEALRRLRGDGIEVEGPQDEVYGRFAWVRDPEGNRIELYQEIQAAD